MTRKRRRSNLARNTMILAIVGVLLIVIVASYNSGQVKPRYEASEYFEIYDAAYFPATGNKSTIQIMILGFYIRAIMGDAHNVHVHCGNMPSPELVGNGTILKGQSVAGEIYPNIEFPAVGVGNSFPIEISVSSSETDPSRGDITILLEQR